MKNLKLIKKSAVLIAAVALLLGIPIPIFASSCCHNFADVLSSQKPGVARGGTEMGFNISNIVDVYVTNDRNVRVIAVAPSEFFFVEGKTLTSMDFSRLHPATLAPNGAFIYDENNYLTLNSILPPGHYTMRLDSITMLHLTVIELENTAAPAIEAQPEAQPVAQPAVQPIRTTVDGMQVHFNDTQPIVELGRTLVPVRGLFEHLGFEVNWNDNTNTASLTRPGQYVTIVRGDAFFTVNGQRHAPDVPPQIIDGRFMLPLRAIAEATGTEIDWDGEARTVIVSTSTIGAPANQPVQEAPANIYSSIVNDQAEQQIPEQAPPPTHPEWQAPFLYTTSDIAIPNRRLSADERQNWINEYEEMGGASAFELEAIRIINDIRREHGLTELQIDPALMYASRFYAQTLSNLDRPLGHREGPYGGSGATAQAFGASWNAANAQAGARTPQALVDSWMNSPGHRANILNENLRIIGLGSQLGGQWGVFHYSLKSIS
ncbi:MAG: stalk domain-containing protein [Defluviitaleaceae bacterium]|nr:stalk domain-containing protein [Defluviitaleaceae bacterium]